MYQRVRSSEGRLPRRDWSLAAPIALVVVLAIVLIVPMINAGRLLYRFNRFEYDLAQSMSFAERNGASRERGNRFYTMVVDAGMGKPASTFPDEPGTLYEFGDGSTLELWPVDIDGDPDTPGTLIRYTRSDGDVFAYDTDRLDYQTCVDVLVGT